MGQVYKVVSTDETWGFGTKDEMDKLRDDLKSRMPSRFFFVHPHHGEVPTNK